MVLRLVPYLPGNWSIYVSAASWTINPIQPRGSQGAKSINLRHKAGHCCATRVRTSLLCLVTHVAYLFTFPHARCHSFIIIVGSSLSETWVLFAGAKEAEVTHPRMCPTSSLAEVNSIYCLVCHKFLWLSRYTHVQLEQPFGNAIYHQTRKSFEYFCPPRNTRALAPKSFTIHWGENAQSSMLQPEGSGS